MRQITNKLTVSAVIATMTLLGAACSSEPTSADITAAPGLAAHSGHIFMSGPTAITTAGTYTYQAYAGLLYPTFALWGFRACNTSAISVCTTAWTAVQGTWIDDHTQRITRNLTPDCGFNGKKAYQVRAIASGSGHPPDTAYFVTKRCSGV